METSSGFCERGYELSSSLKGGISRMPDRRPFFYWLLKKDCSKDSQSCEDERNMEW
jgi:hypothetical protein